MQEETNQSTREFQCTEQNDGALTQITNLSGALAQIVAGSTTTFTLTEKMVLGTSFCKDVIPAFEKALGKKIQIKLYD